MHNERRAGLTSAAFVSLKTGFFRKGKAMDMLTYAGHAAGAIEPPHAFRDQVAHLFARIGRARKARRDFETLSGASDHLLADIGLTRGQIDHALATPFWVNPSDRIALARRGL
jgi:uncharacterized protein YjiS (DUF1127 family)